MKNKFQQALDAYYDKKISLDDFIYNIKYLHREKFRIDSENLKAELHPKLQEILPQLIKKVEKKTDLIYYGIYNGLEDGETNIKHYHVKFQHKFYYVLTIDLSVGQPGSKGNEYYVDDDNKVHLGITTGTCESVWGEYEINDKNLMNKILLSIIKFNKDYTY